MTSVTKLIAGNMLADLPATCEQSRGPQSGTRISLPPALSARWRTFAPCAARAQSSRTPRAIVPEAVEVRICLQIRLQHAKCLPRCAPGLVGQLRIAVCSVPFGLSFLGTTMHLLPVSLRQFLCTLRPSFLASRIGYRGLQVMRSPSISGRRTRPRINANLVFLPCPSNAPSRTSWPLTHLPSRNVRIIICTRLR
ncbi:hypothetical protein BKA93DRAFT_470932 [Sparassis latifolia]